jgi:hypothetical protein
MVHTASFQTSDVETSKAVVDSPHYFDEVVLWLYGSPLALNLLLHCVLEIAR